MNAVSEAPALASAAPPRSVEELLAELLSRSPAERVEIITRLAQSLHSAVAKTETSAPAQASLPAFVGAWTNDPEADKMEQAILAVRHSANEPEIN